MSELALYETDNRTDYIKMKILTILIYHIKMDANRAVIFPVLYKLNAIIFQFILLMDHPQYQYSGILLFYHIALVPKPLPSHEGHWRRPPGKRRRGPPADGSSRSSPGCLCTAALPPHSARYKHSWAQHLIAQRDGV